MKKKGRLKDIEKWEEEILKEERKLEEETKKIESVERDIKSELQDKPLTKVSLKDLNKGIIGAFIGVVAHFSFVYGKEIAKGISYPRAALLLFFSYFLVIILMYETGYRNVRDKKIFAVLPARATVIFLTSIAVIIVIFFLFDQVDFKNLGELYKQIAVTSVLASLGAGTADLIGKN